MCRAFKLLLLLVSFFIVIGCSPFSTEPQPGPDKQAEGTWYGAASGAGAGAIIGAQTTAGTGPGAWVGAGFGAIFGMLSGLGLDLVEEDQITREMELRRAREIAWTQEVLAEHYARRLELHPSRDIFPADWFFEGDNIELRPGADLLVEAITQLTVNRMPWSRIVVAAYTTTKEPHSTYAGYITKRRAETIASRMVNLGIEPRRIYSKSVIMTEPILIDPDDHEGRYRQAIELIPLDY